MPRTQFSSPSKKPKLDATPVAPQPIANPTRDLAIIDVVLEKCIFIRRLLRAKDRSLASKYALAYHLAVIGEALHPTKWSQQHPPICLSAGFVSVYKRIMPLRIAQIDRDKIADHTYAENMESAEGSAKVFVDALLDVGHDLHILRSQLRSIHRAQEAIIHGDQSITNIIYQPDTLGMKRFEECSDANEVFCKKLQRIRGNSSRLGEMFQVSVIEREMRNGNNFLRGIVSGQTAQMEQLSAERIQYALMHCIAVIGKAYLRTPSPTLENLRHEIPANEFEVIKTLVKERGEFVHEITAQIPFQDVINYATSLCRLNYRLAVFALRLNWSLPDKQRGQYTPFIVLDILQFANKYPNPMGIFDLAMATFSQSHGIGDEIFMKIAECYIANLDKSTANIPEKIEQIPDYNSSYARFRLEIQHIDVINLYILYARSAMEFVILFSSKEYSHFTALFPLVGSYFSEPNDLAKMAFTSNNVFASLIAVGLRNKFNEAIGGKSESWLTSGRELIRRMDEILASKDSLAVQARAGKEGSIMALEDEYIKWTAEVQKIIENTRKLQKLIDVVKEEVPTMKEKVPIKEEDPIGELISLKKDLEDKYRSFAGMQKQLLDKAHDTARSTSEMVAQLRDSSMKPSIQPQPQSKSPQPPSSPGTTPSPQRQEAPSPQGEEVSSNQGGQLKDERDSTKPAT